MIQRLSDWLIPAIVSLALFMEALDTTIINTAIPVMAQSLNVNPIDLKIALISYLLSLAIFIPISGWLADKFGVKRVFISALVIFTLSSLWCGFSHHLLELVIARTVQGLGGALTVPVGRLIIVRLFARHQLISVMGRIAMVASLGMLLGPVLGGFISHYFSWSWIFWINIPVGLLSIVLASRWLTDVPPQAVFPLDKLGFILFGGSLAGFTFGLSALSETAMSGYKTLLILLVALLLLVGYIWHSRTQPYPIVKKELFRFRTFKVSTIGNLLSRLGFGGVPFLVPLLLQIGLDYPAQISGLLLAPMAIGMFFVRPFILSVLRLCGYKRLLIINTILLGISICAFALVNSHTSIYEMGALTFIFGLLISLQYSTMNSLAYVDIDSVNLSAATSIMGTLQQLAQSFGVAVSAVFIRYFALISSPKGELTPAVFHYTFLAMGIITVFSILIFIRLKPGDGQQMMQPI